MLMLWKSHDVEYKVFFNQCADTLSWKGAQFFSIFQDTFWLNPVDHEGYSLFTVWPCRMNLWWKTPWKSNKISKRTLLLLLFKTKFLCLRKLFLFWWLALFVDHRKKNTTPHLYDYIVQKNFILISHSDKVSCPYVFFWSTDSANVFLEQCVCKPVAFLDYYGEYYNFKLVFKLLLCFIVQFE